MVGSIMFVTVAYVLIATFVVKSVGDAMEFDGEIKEGA